MNFEGAAKDLVTFLHSKCGLCQYCIGHLIECNEFDIIADVEVNNEVNGDCTVCLGLSTPSFQASQVLPEIRRSLIPYCLSCQNGGTNDVASNGEQFISSDQGNYLSRESPTVQLPQFILVRASCAIAAAKSFLDESNNVSVALRTAEQIFASIKDGFKSSIREMCQSLISFEEQLDGEALPQQLINEESGFLTIHIIVFPNLKSIQTSNTDEAIASLIPPTLRSRITRHKQKIQSSHYKVLHPRTRFRGNDPTLKQGGDPRKNLELRLRREAFGDCDESKYKCRRLDGYKGRKKSQQSNQESFSWDATITWLDKDTVNHWLEEDDCSKDSAEWLQKLHASNGNLPASSNDTELPLSVSATTWRRPFCVHGYYTKTKRDVSQTPFYVSPSSDATPVVKDNSMATDEKDESNKSDQMVRKGASSVEEEICPHITAIGCGGISTMNNDNNSPIVYGMCKFHASGREDIDVRMLLPHPSVIESYAGSNTCITGRPFVCEIFDAHRVPTLNDLKDIEDTINRNDGSNDKIQPLDNEIEWNQQGWPQALVNPNRSYGNSANGVGVSSLKLVSSDVFSTLQSETENKVKHYGCICWSELAIESDDTLLQKLGCSPWNTNANTTTTYPLEIKQSTPIRVLHRRSSDVRIRHILTLSACRIDQHWFRLRMSTSAGTYVKEFVHGDCGRTYPSVHSMLGGRVDITELDCEGIVSEK